MIATIAVIAAITEKNNKFSDRYNDSDHFSFQRSLESGFHMIAMIATIDELFFAQRSQRSQRW